jgi:outer membrane receptor protein involved in Fe transport
LDENLQIPLVGRYTKDKREATRDLFIYSNGVLDESKSQEDTSNNDRYTKFNPAFIVAYDWDVELSTYLRIATGYKAGSSSELGPVDEFSNTVEPENVVSYEVGLKSY